MSVPKIFHRIWLGSDLPDWAIDIYESWMSLHPGWEHRLWTHENLPRLRNQAIFDRAEKITAGNPWQLRSDIARYELLYDQGGVFLDTDIEALVSIEGLCEAAPEGWLPWEEDQRWIGNTIIASPPGAGWLADAIAMLPVSAVNNHGQAPTRISGPQFLTRQVRPDVCRWPQSYFFPFSYRDVASHFRNGDDLSKRYPDAYAVHWWLNSRRRKGLSLCDT